MDVQIIANGINASVTIALVACGFGLFYRVHRFFHIAHAMVIASGAYGTQVAWKWFGVSPLSSILCGIVTACAAGCVIEAAVYRTLRVKGAGPLVLLIASVGVFVFLQNVAALVFGNDPLPILEGPARTVSVLGARVSWIQITALIATVALLLGTHLVLRWTGFGLAIRAIADDPHLADLLGLPAERGRSLTAVLASGLGGVAGIVLALETAASPLMGLGPLMFGVVAFIVGGGGLLGTVLAALLLGLTQHLGAWVIGSQWQDAIAFIVLLAFLLVRPEDFLGKKLRKAAV